MFCLVIDQFINFIFDEVVVDNYELQVKGLEYVVEIINYLFLWEEYVFGISFQNV